MFTSLCDSVNYYRFNLEKCTCLSNKLQVQVLPMYTWSCWPIIAEQLWGAQSLNARFYAKALAEWENGFFDIKGRQVQNENK